MIGGTSPKNFFNGINGKQILKEGGNQQLINQVEASGVTTPSMIDKLANTIEASGKKIHPTLVKTIKDYNELEDSIKQTTTLSEYFVSQNVTGLQRLGGMIKNFAGNFAATLGNAFMSAGISIIVSAVLSAGYKLYDSIAHKAENIKKAADDARQSIKSINDEISNTQKTVGELGKSYAELAQQVGNLGTANQNQGGLNTEQYQEFLDISNQLAEVFPTLTKGYDDNGNAILDLSGNVDTIVSSLNELVKVEQELANQKVLENMDKIWQDFGLEIDNAREKIKETKESFEGVGLYNGTADAGWKEQLDVFNKIVGEGKNRTWGVYGDPDSVNIETKYLQDAFKIANVEWKKIVHDGVFHVEDLEQGEIEKIRSAFQTLKANYESEIKGYENEIKKQNLEMGKYVAQSIKTGGYYEQLNDAEKKIAEGYTLNLDYDKLLDENGDWETTFNKIQDQLRNTFENITPANKMLVQKYYDELFSIDLSDGSYQDNLDKIMQYARLIVSILGDEFSTFDIIKALGLDSAFEKRDVARERMGYSKNPNSRGEAERNSQIDAFMRTLSSEDLEVFAKFEFDKNASMEEIKKQWAEFQKYADENPIEAEVTASDAVDSMNKAKTAVTSLDNLWQQTVQKKATSGQATGYADPALLTSVRSAFGDFSKDLENKGDKQGAETINQSLKDFETTLVEFPNDAGKAQDAMNKLITVYIDHTDIIKNLTEENAEWSKAQLKAMGITNAEEVVETRLTKKMKAMTAALKSLSAEYENYNSIMKNSTSSDEDKASALSGLTNKVNDAIANYDDNGVKQDNSIQVNDQFVKQHLEDVQAMADGDIDALNRVRQAAAKQAVMNVFIGIPTDVAEAQLDEIMGMIAQADAMNIEPGAYIDDTEFLNALANMMQASQRTSDAVNAAFEAMGYTVEWIPHPYTVTYVKAHETDIKDSKAYNTMLQKATEQIDLPSLRVKRNGTAGAQAKYHPTSSGTGGNGGNGGSPSGSGDNSSGADKATDEEGAKQTAETYDWIAVAIQRLEEEIDRLDKRVNNVFKSWTSRNENLTKEIEKVTDEIKAQELAASEYQRNANLVSFSGQNLTNKDVKLISEAEAKWKKGTYQDLAKKGKLKQKDVDKIKNAYLQQSVQELLNQQKRNKDIKKENKEIRKKNEKITDPKKKKKEKKLDKTKYRIGDLNMPKRSDYNSNKEYKQAMKDYNKSEKIWAKNSYQDKVKNGLLSGNDIEQITNEYLKGAIDAFKELNQQEIDARDNAEDLRRKWAELNKVKFDNIKSQFDEIMSYIEGHVNDIDERISRVEEMGYFVDERFYKEMIAQAETKYNNLVLEREQLMNQLNEQVMLPEDEGGVVKYSEAWYEMYNTIQGVNTEIEKSITETYKWGNELKKLQWDKLDFLDERLKKFKEEGDWIRELLSYKDMYDENGRYNNRGWASSAIIDEEYRYAQENVKRYEQLMKDFREGKNEFKGHAYDKYSKDDIAEMDKLNEAYRENISLTKEMAEANKELVQNGISKHLESLKELIDKYNESLSSAKDLYDWQKNVSNQTSNINSLQRQLQAYGGDDSEEGRKRRQELRKQLQDAEQQLQETEWDRYISQTNKMLDNLYNDYEEFLNARLDDIIVLMQDQQVANNGQGKAISDGLKETQKAFSADFRNYGNLVDNKFGTIQSAFENTFTDMTKSIKEITDPDDSNPNNPLGALLKLSKAIVDDPETGKVALSITDISAQIQAAQDDNKNKNKNTNTAPSQEDIAREKAKAELAEAESQLINAQNKQGQDVNTLNALHTQRANQLDKLEELKVNKKANKAKIEQVNYDLTQIQKQIDNYEKNIIPVEDQSLIEYWINRINEIKAILEANAYATGSKHISKKQMAWTQEEGSELIFRSSDGAMLTPLNQGDMVFTNEMSQRLWEIASGDVPSTIGGLKLPDISGNVQTNITANNEITISLPNVNDYESFKNELQNDSRFEKFIQEVTIGQALGNNTLNKRKY